MFIHLLLEHQSTVDRWMPLRLLGYMVRLWELWRKQNPDAAELPGIIPVLFYHGTDEWDVSVRFQDMIDAPDLTDAFVPKFEYLLRDFSPSGDEEIRGTVLLRLFLSLMGQIFSPRFGEAVMRGICQSRELGWDAGDLPIPRELGWDAHSRCSCPPEATGDLPIPLTLKP